MDPPVFAAGISPDQLGKLKHFPDLLAFASSRGLKGGRKGGRKRKEGKERNQKSSKVGAYV